VLDTNGPRRHAVRTNERRVDVHITSGATLGTFLKFHDMSYAALAEAATRELIRKRQPHTVSKSLVSHLVRGRQKQTHEDIAKAICKVLDIPVGALFVARVSTVSRDVPPTRRTAA
jgi:transcriptional regulator with XRE-family HTH domain